MQAKKRVFLNRKTGVILSKSAQVSRNEWKSANYMKSNTLGTSLFQLKYNFISKMWVLLWEMQSLGQEKRTTTATKCGTFECYVTDLIEKCCWPFRIRCIKRLEKCERETTKSYTIDRISRRDYSNGLCLAHEAEKKKSLQVNARKMIEKKEHKASSRLVRICS